MRPSLRSHATVLAVIPFVVGFLVAVATPSTAADTGARSASQSAAEPAVKNAAMPAAVSASAPAVQPSPAFRAAMKRFLLAQNIPTQMGEQMAYSAAEQFLAPLAASGVAVTEPMQALVLDEARKDFGKRYGDVEYLTELYSGVYARHFSDEEITELAAFWESPVAKKLLASTETINESFITQLQSATKTQMNEFQVRMENQLRAAGILGSAP
ncbi:MAG: DUF2059 domain-containing protein [Deltaproteobacteria bacterium]|nr:DUF2059 domain-containing protein [Deltaproteobacteria bacterium]